MSLANIINKKNHNPTPKQIQNNLSYFNETERKLFFKNKSLKKTRGWALWALY
jgi:hypothetical protein